MCCRNVRNVASILSKTVMETTVYVGRSERMRWKKNPSMLGMSGKETAANAGNHVVAVVSTVCSPLRRRNEPKLGRKSEKEKGKKKVVFFIHMAFKTEKMEIERLRPIKASFSPKVENRLMEVEIRHHSSFFLFTSFFSVEDPEVLLTTKPGHPPQPDPPQQPQG